MEWNIERNLNKSLLPREVHVAIYEGNIESISYMENPAALFSNLVERNTRPCWHKVEFSLYFSLYMIVLYNPRGPIPLL
jgi:hypothetical protein